MDDAGDRLIAEFSSPAVSAAAQAVIDLAAAVSAIAATGVQTDGIAERVVVGDVVLVAVAALRFDALAMRATVALAVRLTQSGVALDDGKVVAFLCKIVTFLRSQQFFWRNFSFVTVNTVPTAQVSQVELSSLQKPF